MNDITVTQVRLVNQKNLDEDGRISTVSLMSWIYETAVITAMQSCGCKVVVRTSDHHDFCHNLSDCSFLEITGRPVHAGESSMEIQVDLFAENPRHKKVLITRSYLTVEAVDNQMHPVRIA